MDLKSSDYPLIRKNSALKKDLVSEADSFSKNLKNYGKFFSKFFGQLLNNKDSVYSQEMRLIYIFLESLTSVLSDGSGHVVKS